MAVLTTLSLNTIEEGDISNEKSEPPHTSKSQGAIVIFTFNAFLLCLGYLIYQYISALDDKKRTKVGNWMCSLVGVVLMIVMYRMGDMSKGNPHFYYI
ncbi:PREDICTED: uncharacterized protein LOC108610294 isoform X3 [Drosophila arizonae]|uniref:Uncharacterized protein LOC108610294 isoform X3 n=1 Tax=Drosophila arizonae TaxID=7263 RepID=A0ABM1NS70_DROAR|nr:PREDICTED: uncharacterized protein LOC108610294 isoform X3 [Drosophila arizonae]